MTNINKNYIQLRADQRSPQWISARQSKLTASNFGKATKILKSGKPSQERDSLKYEKAGETLSKIGYSLSAMPKPLEWGTEVEQYAFNLYKSILAEQGLRLEKSYLSFSLSSDRLAASPDGEIYDADGNLVALLEIKCPTTRTHIEYLLDDKAPTEYYAQMMLQMTVLDIDVVHFVSFDPRLSGDNSLVIRKFSSTKEDRENALTLATKFIEEVKEVENLVSNTSYDFYEKYSVEHNIPHSEIRAKINKARIDFINNSYFGKFVENRTEIESETASVPTFTALEIDERKQLLLQVSQQNILLENIQNAITDFDKK